MCTYVRMYGCMYVCMEDICNVCMYVCMEDVCMYVMYVWLYGCMDVCNVCNVCM